MPAGVLRVLLLTVRILETLLQILHVKSRLLYGKAPPHYQAGFQC